jgi:hypothetical protein
MAGVLASMGCSTVCCAASALTSALCSCCPSGGGKNAGRTAKLFYLLLQAMATVLALVMRYYGADGLDLYAWKINCGASDSMSHLQKDYFLNCKGNAAVYRVSFMQAVFFLCMTLGTLCWRGCHAGAYALKSFVWLGLMLASVFIPNWVFDESGYAPVSRVASVLFLVAQVLVLIEFAYTLNEDWDRRYLDAEADGKSGTKWHAAILGICACAYLAWIVGVGLMFGDGALLPSAVVAAYSTYLCWGALSSDPDPTCNPLYEAAESPWLVATGIACTAVSLAWTSFSAATSMPNLFHGQPPQDAAPLTPSAYRHEQTPPRGPSPTSPEPAVAAVTLTEIEIEDEEAEAEAEAETEGGGDAFVNHNSSSTAAEPERYSVFHAIMLFAALYMGMLLTDWGSGAQEGSAHPAGGKTAMWVKILSQWLTMLIYIWTLIAPSLFPDRDF